MTALIYDHMRQYAAIILEEPPNPNFDQMLAGNLAVNAYLAQMDIEYPAYSRLMCKLLRKLNAECKQIFQVEPFWEILLGIHEFFADGHNPEEIDQSSVQYPVYVAEKNATRALLDYYQTIVSGSFNQAIRAIMRFARMDAARFVWRDSLRAQAIATMVGDYPSAYIEAGVMHYPLFRLLRRQLPDKQGLKVSFLADPVLKNRGLQGHLFGPGDQLTLLYVYHPAIRNTRRERVLAARSMIHSKIALKEELADNLSTFPHLHDEIECIGMTRQLSITDCRRLFPLVRRAGSAEARKTVTGYLAESHLHDNHISGAIQAGRLSKNGKTTL
jgi:hypothetical protein